MLSTLEMLQILRAMGYAPTLFGTYLECHDMCGVAHGIYPNSPGYYAAWPWLRRFY